MTPDERLQRAQVTLEGLSVGDALGGFFEFNNALVRLIETRELPSAPWHYTDDTNMALSIFQILRQYGEVEQDELAQSFAKYFDRTRGYGMGARALVVRMRKGAYWRDIASAMYDGGSYGNGGAMRVAPIGAYFADNLERVVQHVARSSEITHAHHEGIAGAIAVAVAAAFASRLSAAQARLSREEFIELILPYVPESEVRDKVRTAHSLPSDMPLDEVVTLLGNGQKVSAQSTVPFVLWSAGESLDNYENATWNTIQAGGDVDTTCAMVGGIVATYTGIEGIPTEWIERREVLPAWAFED